MNEKTNQKENAKSALGIRPKLEFFHPNGKGTGCAVRLELIPAHDREGGSIMLSAANQLTIGNLRGPNPVYPRFNWEGKIVVRLDFNDLCKILQVLRGECESLEDGHGLYHRTAKSTTKIVLRHLTDQVPGYSFELYRTLSSGEDDAAHFLFNPAEALGLCESIADSMSLIAFGVPMALLRSDVTRGETNNANAA